MKVSASFLACKKIYPAIFNLSFTDVDYIHIDYIDNTYVTGKKLSFRKLKKIRDISSKRLDVHLMSNKLEKNIKRFALLNCEYITFHIETTNEVEKYINMIHSYGIKCGIAISPDTDVELLYPFLNNIDLVLVMSVVPGYGGQAFIPEVIDKIKKLKKYITDNKLSVIINVDGGINNETVKKVKRYVDMVVSGSYITSSDNYQDAITTLR